MGGGEEEKGRRVRVEGRGGVSVLNLVQVTECAISGPFPIAITIIKPRNYFNTLKYVSVLLLSQFEHISKEKRLSSSIP